MDLRQGRAPEWELVWGEYAQLYAERVMAAHAAHASHLAGARVS